MTTSSSSSANSTKINFTGICEYTSQPFQKETDLYCMASLQAPCFKPNDSEKRKGIDLVCIVDKSGSMSGVNIERVKSTLSFMFDQLTADDRVAIVEFNSTITTSLTFSKMNEQGRNQAKHIASNIHASGGTNISDALFEGLKLVGARELDGANEVTSIILLTDGMTNSGITSIEGIIEGMNALLEDLAKKNMNSISIHTFGFGTSTDANILGGIAQAGNGLFDVLETADDIPKAFGNVIGNLLSVVGQNIKVKIETKSNVSLKKVLTGFKVQQLTNGSEVIIGDVYSEEKKDIVFILSLPVAEHPIDVQELASVSLSYFNVIDLETELIGYDMTIDRNSAETPTKSESNYQLDIQRNRVEVGEAMSKARTLGDTNQLEQGRTVLNEAIAKVQASVSADEALCQDLIADMRNCLKKMDDRNNYKLFGNRMLNNCGRTNLAQRSSSSACSSSQKAYRTNNQNQFTNLFLNNVSSLTPVQPSQPQPQQQQTNSTNFILPTSSRSGNRPLVKSNRIITITKNSTTDQVNQ